MQLLEQAKVVNTCKAVNLRPVSVRIFSLLSAILHLGNIRYKKKTYRDDSIDICNPEVLPIVSELLEVSALFWPCSTNIRYLSVCVVLICLFGIHLSIYRSIYVVYICVALIC